IAAIARRRHLWFAGRQSRGLRSRSGRHRLFRGNRRLLGDCLRLFLRGFSVVPPRCVLVPLLIGTWIKRDRADRESLPVPASPIFDQERRGGIWPQAGDGNGPQDTDMSQRRNRSSNPGFDELHEIASARRHIKLYHSVLRDITPLWLVVKSLAAIFAER